MDKDLQSREGPVLGIGSSAELYEKLKFEGARLRTEWHPYDAFNFVLTAWHLYQDWLPVDRLNRPSHASAKLNKRKLPEEMVLVLDVLRDLSNGSKHLTLDPGSAGKRVVSSTHSGEISSYWAYFFQERIVGVTTANYYYFSIRKLSDIVLAYFAWVFDDNAPATPFPGELLWNIWRCAPKNRDKNAVPPSGALPGEEGDPEFVA
ncbi:hypothetical protein [Polaromonas sp.]|uniref:hypothetical protein n=1 Tax=Polaromonas sp. TaxID=1869339 RepID=UPI002731312C|nr:hypothetical protein [Polaromonas sp.]MDP1889201.1 hypothetical protein [Polaromonas sp.]